MFCTIFIILYVVFVISDLAKKLPINNVAVSVISLLTMPVVLGKYIMDMFVYAYHRCWFNLVFSIIMIPIVLAACIYILVKINIIPLGKKEEQTQEQRYNNHICGIRKLIGVSLAPTIIYQVVITAIMATQLVSFIPMFGGIIFIQFFVPAVLMGIYTFAIAPIIVCVLYVIAVAPVVNAIIRYELISDKKAVHKVVTIIFSFFVIVNFVMAIVIMVKCSKKINQNKSKISVNAL